MGIAGDAGTRAIAQQPRLFVSMVLILIFAEVLGMYRRGSDRMSRFSNNAWLGLYGVIVALIIDARAKQGAGLCAGRDR